MRQILTIADEPYLSVRSLSVTYASGWTSLEHTHAWPQLLYCGRGATRVELNKRVWVVPPRRGLWIPAGVKHRIHALGRLELRTLYCKPNSAELHDSVVRGFTVAGLLHEAILRICELGALDQRCPAHATLADLVRNEIQDAKAEALALPLPTDARALRLSKLFLEATLSTTNLAHSGISLATSLATVGLSRRTAERLFVRETGLTPARWYRWARLGMALEKLLNGSSIEEAMFATGFRSRSAFTEAFTSTFGYAPADVLQMAKT